MITDAALAAAAQSRTAEFHFLRLVIQMDCARSDVIDENGVKDEPTTLTARLAHEYAHYTQAMSTVLGRSVLTNWQAVILATGRQLWQANPIVLPLKDAEPASPEGQAWRTYSEFISEHNLAIGQQAFLRPAQEFIRTPSWDFFDFVYLHPRGATATHIAVVVPTAEGGRVGVPLFGDAFLEGMAKAVQRLALPGGATGPWSANSKELVFYNVVAGCVQHWLPGWPLEQTVLLLTEVALMSRRPGVTFVSAIRGLANRGTPLGLADLVTARRQIATLSEDQVASEVYIREKVETQFRMVENVTGVLSHRYREILVRIRRLQQAMDNDPATVFAALASGKPITHLSGIIGSPPILFKNTPVRPPRRIRGEVNWRTQRRQLAQLPYEPAFFRACVWFDAATRALEDLGFSPTGLHRECFWLKTGLCGDAKGEHCRVSPKSAPFSAAGGLCIEAEAAATLQLRDKPCSGCAR